MDDGTEKAPEESAAPEEESSEVAAPEAEQPQEPQTEEDLLTGGSEATGAAQQDEQYKNMIAENMDDIFNQISHEKCNSVLQEGACARVPSQCLLQPGQDL